MRSRHRGRTLGAARVVRYSTQRFGEADLVLIIAIPKSVSTSLVATLSELHHLPIATRDIRENVLMRRPIAAGFRQLALFHRRDLVEIDERVVTAIAAPGVLAKFHFPPTQRNQAQLQRVPKVVLLRDAEEIVSSYRRGEETGAWPSKSYEFAYCFSERGWQARARATGLIGELRAFADGWRAHTGAMLLLESREVIADPATALARVERYLGLEHSGETRLREERFSRGASVRRAAPRMLMRRRNLIARRMLADVSRLLVGNIEWIDGIFESRRRSKLAPVEAGAREGGGVATP